MSKTVKCKIDYEENCDYKASTITRDVDIPQQNVFIDIQKPQVVNINNRLGKDGNGQFYSTLTDTYYYNETLQVTTIVYKEIVDEQGNIGHSDTPIKIGKIHFKYIDAKYPTNIISISDNPLPISKDGLVTFNFIPHYDGYIQATYICEDDEDQGFYKNTQTGNGQNCGDNREVILSKIPVYVTPNTDNIFIEREKEIKLTCNVTDIYGHQLDYGHVSFMGYHDVDPEALVNPTEGMGVMLGNPAEVKDGLAVLEYAPEQDLDIEYIHGLFNYNNEKYGNDFKYYHFHNNVIRVFSIKTGDYLSLIGGKVVNNNIDTTCDFDGFIHTQYGDSIKLNILFNEKNFVFYDDMEMIIHIDYTQYHLKEAFTTSNINDVTKYIEDNATFTTGTQQIRITKEEQENTHEYGTEYIVNDWMPGYYSVYITFKDAVEKNNTDRQYYNDLETYKIYFAVDYPNVSLSLDDITCTDQKFTVQSNTNFSNYLKVKCNDSVPKSLTGTFNINGKNYKAILNNQNEFIIQSSLVTIKNIGNYSVSFSTNNYYDPDTKKIYAMQFSSMPHDNPVLKVRDTLEPIVSIPKGYVDNEYPGSIQYQLSVKNYYDGEYTIKSYLYKDNVKEKNLDEIIYNGSPIEKVINDLSVGRYKIRVELYDDKNIRIGLADSVEREITPCILEASIASPFDADNQEITTGLPTTIPYIINSHKADMTNYNTDNIKIWFKHENDNEYTGYSIGMTNKSSRAIYIDYQKIFYKTGKWFTYINQNVNNNVMMINPNTNNINAAEITPHYFIAKTISPIIKFEKNLIDELLDIYVSTTFSSHNNQVLLLQIQISYGVGEVANVYVLTDEDGHITVPLEECDPNLSSPNMQRQIYNIKITIDPENNTLINSLKNKTDTEMINIIRNHYDNLYASNSNLEKFASQIKEMDYCYLFATYKKAIKSEYYGS